MSLLSCNISYPLFLFHFRMCGSHRFFLFFLALVFLQRFIYHGGISEHEASTYGYGIVSTLEERQRAVPFSPFSFSYPTVFAPVIRWELVTMKRSKDSKIFRCLFLLFGMFFGLL